MSISSFMINDMEIAHPFFVACESERSLLGLTNVCMILLKHHPRSHSENPEGLHSGWIN